MTTDITDPNVCRRAFEILLADPSTQDIASGLANYTPITDGFNVGDWSPEDWGRILDALAAAERDLS